ncbi:hypothetical protein ANN_26779 [Periplaneta americana]|uniref:Uncharacterized protein n=1 Tax=Periplaneta americana TaxID=6978 RepID=A0ABQ8RZC3_PERAM|nr:hypothetical protein ANN_26779 [Periplaneta americana]
MEKFNFRPRDWLFCNINFHTAEAYTPDVFKSLLASKPLNGTEAMKRRPSYFLLNLYRHRSRGKSRGQPGGDFNTNLLNSSNYATVQLKNMFESYNISILPSAATHHTQESETLLDIIATTNPQLALTNGQLPAPGISAHDIIFLEYSLYCPKYKPHITSYRDLKHIEHDELINDALSLPWTEVWNLPDIDDKIENLTT